jgi:hypothetical protein
MKILELRKEKREKLKNGFVLKTVDVLYRSDKKCPEEKREQG